MDGNLDKYIQESAAGLGISTLRDKVTKAQQRAKQLGFDIPDDVADDFYNTVFLESGRSHYWTSGPNKGKVKESPRDPKDGQVAVGFGQIKPGTIKKWGNLDPYNEDDNVLGSLLEFYHIDKADPIARRIGYFAGPNSGALKTYRQTGNIPKGGDFTGTSFEKYIDKSGGFNGIDNYIKNGGKTPAGSGDTDFKAIDDYIQQSVKQIGSQPSQSPDRRSQLEQEKSVIEGWLSTSQNAARKLKGKKRLQEIEAELAKLPPAAAPAPAPSQPRTYTKREIKPGESYYKFETEGKAGDLTWLGMSDGEHYFKNSDGDEFRLDEKTKSLVPVTPFPKRLKFEDGEITRVDETGKYTNADGDTFQIEKTEQGYTRKPLGPTRRITLDDENKTVLTRAEKQDNVKSGELRYTDEKGTNFIRSEDGKIREENPKLRFKSKDGKEIAQTDDQSNLKPGETRVSDGSINFIVKESPKKKGEYSFTPELPAWVTGKTKPQTKFDLLVEGEYKRFLDTIGGEDTEEKRQKFLQGASDADIEMARLMQSRDVRNLPQTAQKVENKQRAALGASVEQESQTPANFTVDVPLASAPKNQTRRAYAIRKIAEQVAQKFNLPLGDVDQVLREEVFTRNDKSVTEEALADRDSIRVEVAGNIVDKVRALPKIKKQVEAQFDASKKIYQAQGDDEFIADVKAKRDLKLLMPGMDADEEIRLYKDELARIEREADRIANRSVNPNPEQFGGVYDSQERSERIRAAAVENFRAQKLAELNSKIRSFGSLAKAFEADREAAERYKFRPLAAPLETAKGFYAAVPQAASAVLRAIDILREIAPVDAYSMYRAISGNNFKATEGTAYMIADGIDSLTERVLGKNPDLQNYYQAGNVFGQVAVQMGLGALTGGAAVPLIAGSALGAAEQYKEADKAGATPEQRKLAAIIGGAAAISDAIPLAKFLQPLNKIQRAGFIVRYLNSLFGSAAKEVGEKQAQAVVKGAFARMVESAARRSKDLAVGFVLEGTQELSEKKINDFVASLTYDPRRKAFELTSEDAVEFIFGGLGGGFGAAGSIVLEKAIDASQQQPVNFSAQTIADSQPSLSNAVPVPEIRQPEASFREKRPISPIQQRQMVNQLSALGFTNAEIDAISPADAQIIIQNKVSPQEWAELEQLAGNMDAPQPERDVTLKAQAEAMMKRQNETAIGVLYTDGERTPEPPAHWIKEISTPNGVLHVNIPKLKTWFEKENPGEEFNREQVLADLESGKIPVTDIIGGKVKVFDDTSGGTAVVTVDEQGNELNATKISDAEPDALSANRLKVEQKEESAAEGAPRKMVSRLKVEPKETADKTGKINENLPESENNRQKNEKSTHKPRVVEVNGKQVELTPEQQARWEKEVDEPLARAKAEFDEDIKKAEREEKSRGATNSTIRETANKIYKAKAMQIAAVKREITGELTDAERKAKEKREKSNFLGKEVSVDGRNAKVVGNPFGKVKVRFEDGTEKTVAPDNIRPPESASTNEAVTETADETDRPDKGESLPDKGKTSEKEKVKTFKPRQAPSANPKRHSLSRFIILSGGIAPSNTIDLSAIRDAEPLTRKGRRRTGFAAIIRPSGNNIEDVFRSAVESGYFAGQNTEYNEGAFEQAAGSFDFTVDDFVQAVADDLSGRHIRYSVENEIYNQIEEELPVSDEEFAAAATVEDFLSSPDVQEIIKIVEESGEMTDNQREELFQIGYYEKGLDKELVNSTIREIAEEARRAADAKNVARLSETLAEGDQIGDQSGESIYSEEIDESEPDNVSEEDLSFDFGETAPAAPFADSAEQKADKFSPSALFGNPLTPDTEQTELFSKNELADISEGFNRANIEAARRVFGDALSNANTGQGAMLKSVVKSDDQTGEINLKTLYNKDGEINYEQVKSIAGRIVSGESKIVRLNEREERGRILGGRRNVEASIICGAEARANQTKSRGSRPSRQERIENNARVEARLEKYARHEHIWFDYGEFVKNHHYLTKGEEAFIFEDKNKEFVLKAVNYNYFDPKYSALEFIDERISLFNYLFPATHYELIGFTRDDDGHFRFILKQPYIDGKPPAKRARVAFMKRLLGEDSELTSEQFANREYHVSDLHSKNLLQDKNGNIFVIDALLELNTPERHLRGDREYEEFSIKNSELPASNDTSILKSVSPAPAADTPTISDSGFYSAVEKTVLDKMPRRATGKLIKGLLKSAPGVKQSELEWLDINSFLDSKESFSKDEVLNFIRAGQIQVEQVSLSGEDLRFADQQLGGEKSNEREIFLTAPKVNENWSDGHPEYADIKNPVIRLRVNDRTDNTGARVLHIDEIQPAISEQFAKMPAVLQKHAYDIGVKFALRLAAEGGYDAVTFTTGAQQVERSNQNLVDRVQYRKAGVAGDKFAVKIFSKDGTLIKDAVLTLDELEPNFNKSIAQKIRANATGLPKILNGADLQKGEGLRNLYDDRLTNVFNKTGKKFGTRVETTEIETGDGKTEPVHSLAVTPELRESVMNGQPLFRKRDRAAVDQLTQELPTARFHEVIAGMDSKIVGEDLELAPHDAEIIRRASAEYQFRKKGEEIEELPFDGVLFRPQDFRNLLPILRETLAEAKEAGYTAEELKGFENLIENLEKIAAMNQNTGALYVFEEALPEEKFHQEDYLAGNTDSKAKGQIKESEFWQRAQDAGGAFFAEYGHFNENDKISELVAKLATGQFERYGFDKIPDFEKKAEKLLADWAEGILRKNPDIDLNKFERIAKYAKITETYRRRNEAAGNEQPGSNGASPNSGAAEKENRQKPPSDTERTDRQPEQSAAETGDASESGAAAQTEVESEAEAIGGTVSPGDIKTKNRKYAQTLRENGRDADDVPYIPESEAEWINEAKAILRQSREIADATGADDYAHAISVFQSPNTKPSIKTALGIALIDHLGAAGDIKRMSEIAEQAVIHVGTAAQALRATQLVSKYDFAKGIELAQKALAERGKTLTEKEVEKIRELTDLYAQSERERALLDYALQQANETLRELEAENAEIEAALEEANSELLEKEQELVDKDRSISNLKRQLARWKNKVLGDKQSRGKVTRTHKELIDRKAAVMERIGKAFPESMGLLKSVARFAENGSLLKSASSDPVTPDTFDDETRQALVEYAALQIFEGTPYGDLLNNLDQITKGVLTTEEIQEIHADAVDLTRGEKVEKSPDVVKRLKIRNEHYNKAKSFRQPPLSKEAKKAIRRPTLNRLEREIMESANGDMKLGAAGVIYNQAKSKDDFFDLLGRLDDSLTGKQKDDLFIKARELRRQAMENLRQRAYENKANIKTTKEEFEKIRQEQLIAQAAARRQRQTLDSYYEHLKRGTGARVAEAGMEVINFLKGTSATGEISYLLRQGALPLILDTRAAIKGDWQGIGHGLADNPKKLAVFVETVRKHKRFQEAQMMGARFTEIGDVKIADEHFSSKILEKIPLYRRLEAAYTLPGDLQRLYLYDAWATVIEGQTGLNKFEQVKAKKYAMQVINALTGKGDVKKVLSSGGALSKLANVMFFSPSLLVSRFQSAYYLTTGFVTAPKGMRLQMAKKGLRLYTALGLFAYALGMAFDPDDDDFGKIKVKRDSWLARQLGFDGEDLHFDALFGMDVPLRIAFRTAAGLVKAVANNDKAYFTDAMIENSRQLTVNKNGEWRYLRGKLSPSASWAVDAYTGTDFIGRPYTNWGGATSRLLPLSWGQVYDAMLYDRADAMMKEPVTFERAKERWDKNERKYANALTMLTASFLGVGINQYPRSDSSKAVQKAQELSDARSEKPAEQRRIEGGLRSMISEKLNLQAAGRSEEAQEYDRRIREYAEKYKVKNLSKLTRQAKDKNGLLEYYINDLTAAEINRVLPVATPEERKILEKARDAKLKKEKKE